MTAFETFNAAFAALLKWRDEVAPGASVSVDLVKWEHAHSAPNTATHLRLYVGTADKAIASAEMKDDDLPAAFDRLVEDKRANDAKRAEAERLEAEAAAMAEKGDA